MALVDGETHTYFDRYGRKTFITPTKIPDDVSKPCGVCDQTAYWQFVILTGTCDPFGSAFRCNTHTPTTHTTILKTIRRDYVRQLGI